LVRVSGPDIVISLFLNSSSVLCNVLYCAKINRDKAAGKYDKYIGYGDDRDPEFKLVL
jgi:hypothetical protein